MNIYIYKYTRYVCPKMNSWFVVDTLFSIWCLYMLALKWYLSRYIFESLNPNPIPVGINSGATTREKYWLSGILVSNYPRGKGG